MSSSDILDNWHLTVGRSRERLPWFDLDSGESPSLDTKFDSNLGMGAYKISSSPIRPAASYPPTPLLPEPASLESDYYQPYTLQSSATPVDTSRALQSHPFDILAQDEEIPVTAPMDDEFPVGRQSPKKGARIVSPSPKRFVSHPVLMQRASSMSSSVYPPSTSESPGPPPKSPLRLRRDQRSIQDTMASEDRANKSTPKLAPSTTDFTMLAAQRCHIRPTVITDCTGPIKRPKSRGKDRKMGLTRKPAITVSREEREERIRARKLRDRPYFARTIDAVVNAPLLNSRQRLSKNPRPQILIPDLRPAPLVTRASSAFSAGSWQKVTESTHTPVSPVPSEECLPWCPPGKQRTPVSPMYSEGHGTNNEDKTGYTPITPSTTHTNNTCTSNITLSPVMLIAEEVPLPRTKPSSTATKIVVKEGKSYAPRPRSASMSRGGVKRRSRAHSRSGTPIDSQKQKQSIPSLPSPPPNRSLPPTPPVSGSERNGRAQMLETKKELPNLPLYKIAPMDNSSRCRTDRLPHVATQVQQRKSTSSKDSNKTASRIEARFEALEKQNALLSAALMAVLKTNGTLNNGARGSTALRETGTESIPTAWQCRIARRSAASHAASSSNGSALDMYMNTRQGGRYAL